ncbi:MAG: DUF4358 domain-containing protein [Oscillospiraceae bacterium]
MKKVIITLTAIVLILSLAACGSKNVEMDIAAVSKEISGASLFLDADLQSVKAENITGQTGIDTSACASAEYHNGAAATGEEWGLFECNSAKDAEAMVTQLEAHRDSLMTTYKDYAPDAVPRIENAVIMSKGQYVVFITAEKYAEAQKIADKYFA